MDLALVNGNIYTLNDNNNKAEALYIKDGKFIKIGTNEEITSLISDETQVIDVGGKTVLPGFNDSHQHLTMLGSNLYECDLVGVKSIEELIERSKKYIEEKNIKPGEWVIGKGWNEDYFEIKELPSRLDLDKISTEHNLCFTRGCYHMCVVNSRVLDLLGINKVNHDIQGGIFDVDKDGIPTGICRESAMKHIYDQFPKVTKDDIKKYITIATKYLLSRGITSVQTDDFMLPGVDWEDVINAYKEMNLDNQLKVRVYEQCLLPKIDDLREFVEKGYKTGLGDNYFKIGPLKLVTDGNFGTRTAYLTEPYYDDNSTCGISQYTQDELDELISYATESGVQIAAHAIGDRSSEMIVESIDKLTEEFKNKDLRPSIIHFQVTNSKLINKFKELNIIANVQPIFLNYDIHMAESRLGPERIRESYNFKTLYDSKLRIALGSDSPIELPDTVHGIYCAVTRKDLNGYPDGGWYPEEKLSVEEAVKGFTIDSAYASFDEDIKGTIEEGKLADFIILSEDIFEINPDKIKDIKVIQTFVDGELVFEQ